jgi:hypothetical protein
LTYLGFVTQGKLAAIFIKPSLGVSNWPVIYIVNYTPTVLWHYSTPRHHAAKVNDNRFLKEEDLAFIGCGMVGAAVVDDDVVELLS